MNKAVIGVIGIIIVVGVAYFVFFRNAELSFNECYIKIKDIWSMNGIELDSFDPSSPASINSLPETQLNGLKGDLADFGSELSSKGNTSDVKALQELIQLQLDLIDDAILRKKISSGINFLESINYEPDKMCANLSRIDLLAENVSKEYSLTNSYNEKRKAFNESYPDKVSLAGLEELRTNSDAEKIKTLKDSLTEFKTYC